MASIIVRICLRYIAAFLVARGVLPADVSEMIASDADIAAGIEIAAGAGIGAATEAWLYLERRYGWNV